MKALIIRKISSRSVKKRKGNVISDYTPANGYPKGKFCPSEALGPTRDVSHSFFFYYNIYYIYFIIIYITLYIQRFQ